MRRLKLWCLTLLTALVASASTAPALPDLPPGIAVVEADDNLLFIGDRAFSCVYFTSAGVVVIDPINPTVAEAVKTVVQARTEQPIRWVIYSHNHWDHIRGAELLLGPETMVLSHRAAAEKLSPHPEVQPPDLTWSGDRWLLELGQEQLELLYFGENHGAGMTVFRFPERRALFLVDLVVPDRALFTFLPDASPRAWVDTLEAILELDFDTVYMAHERVRGDRSDIEKVLAYFRALYSAVDAELAAGTPPFAIPDRVRLPAFEGLPQLDRWLPMNAWRILMERVIGQ